MPIALTRGRAGSYHGFMIRQLAGVVALGLVCLHAPSTWARTGPHFDEGVRLLKQFDYEGALKAFKEALDWPGNTGKDRAQIHLHIGIVQCEQDDYTAAEASFKRALESDPAAQLPPRTSPKIRAVFEKVQVESKPAEKPALPRRPDPEPATVPVETPPKSDDVSDAEPVVSRPVRWPAWLVLGVAVAAGGAGAAMGALHLSEKSKAEDPKLPWSEAEDHADRSGSYGLTSTILLAAAGAAAVTSGVLFYFAYRKRSPATAALVPTPSGVVVQLEVRR